MLVDRVEMTRLTARQCRERAVLLRARAAVHRDRNTALSYEQLATLFEAMAIRADSEEHNAIQAYDAVLSDTGEQPQA